MAIDSHQSTCETEGPVFFGIRPRFGLRALLLFVFALAVILTWAGARWRALQEQKRILTSLDGFSPGTVFSRGEVVVLSLKSTEIHDEDLRSVGRLSSLEQLDLE